ncbi:MAG: rhamnulokinase [Vallitaleaceae bacterium]|nr:rhamnulokinase [Vallitaleaceae bacterium]
MNKTCIAIDIGASSGRLISSHFEDGKIKLNEVHRFKNQMQSQNEHFYWDIDALFQEILNGLSKIDFPYDSIGIDTWAVDYVLINDEGHRICDVFAYRDHRTDETLEKFNHLCSRSKIYSKTGIQFLPFNTIYQLYEHALEFPEHFKLAHRILLIPDYLNYRLTGFITNEFTNSTSTQLFNIHTKTWDEELVALTHVPPAIFSEVIFPGTVIGDLNVNIPLKQDYKPQVIAPGTHDTASAVAAIPAMDEDFAYISSGTWSLMGIESPTPICTEKSLEYNFTNEGGVFDTVRILKNIMGLWLIQEVKRLYLDQYTFVELIQLAQDSEPFKFLINPNNNRFMNPAHMIEEIQTYCEETGQGKPLLPCEIARCIFDSLAFGYRDVLEKLREISGKTLNSIHIVGGGCQNEFLNQLSANLTGCTVYAGPVEATAIGNILLQHIALGDIPDLKAGRNLVLKSFENQTYHPNPVPSLMDLWKKFKQLP